MNRAKSTHLPLLLALLFAVCGLFASAALSAQPAPIPWETWAALDPALLTNDGTGSTFASAEADGRPALQITPGGTSEETKLAFPVSGGDLQAWANAAALIGGQRLDTRTRRGPVARTRIGTSCATNCS